MQKINQIVYAADQKDWKWSIVSLVHWLLFAQMYLSNKRQCSSIQVFVSMVGNVVVCRSALCAV